MTDWDNMSKQQDEENHKKEVDKERMEHILKNPNLFRLITENEFDKKIVGESGNKKAIFLQNCTIWVKGIREHTLIGGESSVGKDYTTKNVLAIFPKDRVVTRTKITPEALTYWHAKDKDWCWDGKILYLPDISEWVLNSPTFKVMATEGSYATVVRNQKAIDIPINGSPNFVVTTAESQPNNEILNRFSLISLDESESQTKKILEFISSNNKRDYDKDILNALTKLKNVDVDIPFASKLVDYFPLTVKMRRAYPNFLNLVKASAALHQYQRKTNSEDEVIAEAQDYEIAREIMGYIGEQTITGLTSTEERYLRKFEMFMRDKKEMIYSYTEIHQGTKYKSKQVWWNIMKKLEEKGMVQAIIDDKAENSNKPVTKYALTTLKLESRVNLPPFEQLKEI